MIIQIMIILTVRIKKFFMEEIKINKIDHKISIKKNKNNQKKNFKMKKIN